MSNKIYKCQTPGCTVVSKFKMMIKCDACHGSCKIKKETP